MAGKLILCRHGQSEWNLKNLFTGWHDVDLTEKGVAEAREAGRLLSELDYSVDVAFTSVLKRAIRTLWLMLDEMDRMWIPVIRDWRLNERHYGALQGLNKAETAAKYGDEQVHIWRRSYATPPPVLELDDERHPSHDERYVGIEGLPATESLATTLDRVVPCWNECVRPGTRSRKKRIDRGARQQPAGTRQNARRRVRGRNYRLQYSYGRAARVRTGRQVAPGPSRFPGRPGSRGRRRGSRCRAG